MTPPEIVKRPLGDSKQREQPVSGALVHSMGEVVTYEGRSLYAPDLLAEQKLSVHAMVTPDGKVLECLGSDRIAYHAGASRFGDLSGLNATFLGCEFLVAGEHTYQSFMERIRRVDAYTDAQYEAGGWLYARWIKTFSIPRTAVVGHSEVSGDDVRGVGRGKPDPGSGFSWPRFWQAVDTWAAEYT